MHVNQFEVSSKTVMRAFTETGRRNPQTSRRPRKSIHPHENLLYTPTIKYTIAYYLTEIRHWNRYRNVTRTAKRFLAQLEGIHRQHHQ